MCRIANVPGSTSDEMYFEIGGKLFCYSLHHFAMITGLKCKEMRTTNTMWLVREVNMWSPTLSRSQDLREKPLES